MSLRPPARFSPERLVEDGFGLLEHEIAGEMASSLGRAGRRVEAELARLKSLDPVSPERKAALRSTADAVYAYFIQRELCGMRRHADVIRDYAIPQEVLVRLGAR